MWCERMTVRVTRMLSINDEVGVWFVGELGIDELLVMVTNDTAAPTVRADWAIIIHHVACCYWSLTSFTPADWQCATGFNYTKTRPPSRASTVEFSTCTYYASIVQYISNCYQQRNFIMSTRLCVTNAVEREVYRSGLQSVTNGQSSRAIAKSSHEFSYLHLIQIQIYWTTKG